MVKDLRSAMILLDFNAVCRLIGKKQYLGTSTSMKREKLSGPPEEQGKRYKGRC